MSVNKLDAACMKILAGLPDLLRPLGKLYLDAFRKVPKDEALKWLLDAVGDQTAAPAWQIIQQRFQETMSVAELDQVMALCNAGIAEMNAKKQTFDRSVELAIWEIALKGLALL